ncbi:MAG: YggT family protein [Treponema sp.]|nr:YggT family protein [Treponema sp.]
MTAIFSLIASIITIYTILCFIDIIMTWFPGAKYTKFGRMLSRITDPYLRIFSKLRWTHVGYVDFSPIISLGILSLLSTIFGSVASSGRLYLGRAIAEIFRSVWGLCSSLLGFLFVLMLIRFIVILLKNNPYDYNSIWGQLDNFLRPLAEKMAKPFYKNPNSYKYCLLTALIFLIVVILLGNILCGVLINLCQMIPF